MPGTQLFDYAVYMTRLAMRISDFSGIIWHHGESDCNDDESLNAYKEKFNLIITQLKKELGIMEIPIVIGKISEDIDSNWNFKGQNVKLNKIFYEIEKENNFIKMASSKGLKLKNDGIHFDSKSLRLFGKRYFEEMIKIK